MRMMTEVERMQRHEAIIRDSFRHQLANTVDWVRLLTALGLEKDEIKDLLIDFSKHLDWTIKEVAAGRTPS